MKLALLWLTLFGAQESEVVVLASGDLRSWEAPLDGSRADVRVGIGRCFLASPESSATAGAFALEALAAFDAVALSSDELALAKSPLPLLGNGARDYVVKTCGKVRIAFVGQSGLRAIAQAKAESDLQIFLACCDRETAIRICREFGDVDLCLTCEELAADPEPLQVGTTWFVGVPRGGQVAGKTMLTFSGAELKSVKSEIVSAQAGAQEKLAKLRKKFGLPEGSDGLFVKTPSDFATQPALTDERLEPGRVYPIVWRLANRAIELHCRSIALREEYGGKRPASGEIFLVADLEFRNVLPLTFVYDRQVPTSYRVANLFEALYLVWNGRILRRIEGDGLPGHLARQIDLDRLGSRIRGNVLFSIPIGQPESVEIRLYDYAHGHLQIPILEEKLSGTPIVTEKNEVAEVAIHSVRRTPEWAGEKAPAGATYLLVDFRSRSLVEFEVDATAFDPKAKKGTKMRAGTFMDYADAWDSLHLVVDGEYAPPLRAGTTLAKDPRFLPDLMTGGTLVFLIPEPCSSLELVCEFDQVQLADGRIVSPKSIALSLEGRRPEKTPRKKIVQTEDKAYRVTVTAVRTAGKFFGVSPSPGRKFLVLDVTVENQSKDLRRFEAGKQLKCGTETLAKIDMHAATERGLFPPGASTRIPPGESRSVQVVFEISEGDRKPRLDYRGVGKGEILSLPIE